jgi:hypothetical protein
MIDGSNIGVKDAFWDAVSLENLEIYLKKVKNLPTQSVWVEARAEILHEHALID